MIEYRINGGKEIAALMAKLPLEVERKILANGLAAGARVIRDEARSLVPKKTGALANAIKTGRSTKDGYVVAKVSLRGRHAFLGLFMEYGVLPHMIWAKSKESLVINGVAIGKRVRHPGLAARPFMRPALDASAGQAVQAVGDYLTRYLQWGTITAPTVSVDIEEAA